LLKITNLKQKNPNRFCEVIQKRLRKLCLKKEGKARLPKGRLERLIFFTEIEYINDNTLRLNKNKPKI